LALRFSVEAMTHIDHLDNATLMSQDLETFIISMTCIIVTGLVLLLAAKKGDY
tara:strand:- start:161 stop:319 length:159 start_codon:yes stop_codon:yes gene_type:complete